MLGAVEDMVTQTAPGCLKVVRIIIFQQTMVKDFHSRMEKKAGHNTSFLGKLKGKQLLSPKYALKQGSATYGTRVMAGTQQLNECSLYSNIENIEYPIAIKLENHAFLLGH